MQSDRNDTASRARSLLTGDFSCGRMCLWTSVVILICLLVGVFSKSNATEDTLIIRNETELFKNIEFKSSHQVKAEADTITRVILSRTRRVAPSEKRPILNDFSFPANLVQGMRFVLMCQVLDGEPPIRIKWFKDNLDLSEAGRLESLDQVEMLGSDELGASLLFRRVQQQHSGNYTCLASNHHGSSSYSSLMSVKVPPKWKVEPHNQESVVGDQVIIDCQANGNPNPFIRWKFTPVLQSQQLGSNSLSASTSTEDLLATFASRELNQQLAFKLINSNHHVQSLENGSLAIRQANKEHEGYYLCEADNGVEPSLVKILALVVHQQAQIPDDIHLVEPTNSASANGSPANKQSSMLNNNNNINNQPTSLTNLQQQHQTNSGSRQLQVLNSPGALIKSARVVQNVTMVRLLCQPIGEHPLTIEWLKEGQVLYTHSTIADPSSSSSPVTSSSLAAPFKVASISPSASASGQIHSSTSPMPRYHVNSRRSTTRPLVGLDTELIISNLNRADAGVYTCTARNAFGRSERSLKLVVQEPPDAPEVVDVGHISSRSIGLRWLAPFDGNSPITKYVIEYRRHADANGDNSSSSRTSIEAQIGHSEKLMPLKSSSEIQQQQQIQHTVHDLEPLARYTMRLFAVNSVGQSRPSVALSLRTEEEVPSVVPNLVEVKVLSSKSVKLHWTISYSPEREVIDGFFVGYKSLEGQPVNQANGKQRDQQLVEQQTYTFKTIRLTNQQTTAAYKRQPDLILDGSSSSGQSSINELRAVGSQDQSAFLSPVSTITKSVPNPPSNLFSLNSIGQMQSLPVQSDAHQSLVLISTFEFVIGALERNTEYTVLIQCFNKKGAGPISEPVAFKTFSTDPPEKLVINADEITESSFKLSWRFASASSNEHLLRHSESVDGYVLNFARLSQQRRTVKGQNDGHRTSLVDNSVSDHQVNSYIDPAARISQVDPTAGDSQIERKLEQWQAIQLAPQQRNHQLKNLECGTTYGIKIWAFNKVGRGDPSDLLMISTRGKAPIAPDRRSFISVNSTQIRLHLTAWYDGGCEIEKFIVQYRAHGQQEWILVSNNIPKEQSSVVIRDLSPASPYEILVTAQNQVAPTEVRYRFTTLDIEGKQVMPRHSLFDFSSDQNQELDYQDQDPARREPWPSADSSWRSSVILIRQLFSMPFTILLALCLLVFLLVIFVFHQYTPNSGSSTSTLNSSNSNKSSRLGGRNSKLDDHNNTETGDQLQISPMTETPQLSDINSINRRSYGNSRSIQAAESTCGASSQMSLPHNLVLNSRDQLDGDCSSYVYANGTRAAYCRPQQNLNQYATVQRPNGLNHEDHSVLIEDPEQQCLMQMLMMNGQQHNQAVELINNNPNQHYVSAATLGRNKNKLISSSDIQQAISCDQNYGVSMNGFSARNMPDYHNTQRANIISSYPSNVQ